MTDPATPVLFVHPPLDREIRSISGRIEFLREGVVKAGGGEVLYLVGAALADSTCCGEGGVAYALVAGRLVEDRGTNSAGRRQSLVLPLSDEPSRKEIEDAIRLVEPVAQIVFWSGAPLAPDPETA